MCPNRGWLNNPRPSRPADFSPLPALREGGLGPAEQVLLEKPGLLAGWKQGPREGLRAARSLRLETLCKRLGWAEGRPTPRRGSCAF